MQKTYAIFLFLFSALSVFGQTDSLKLEVRNRQLYFTDSAVVSEYAFAKKSPVFLDLIPKQISQISLGHQFEKGGLKPAQGSTKTNIAFLKSEGVTELAGIKLYGAFVYNKVVEDSTKFAHQTRNNTSTPYYLGSPANNHYERSIYDFNAMGAKTLFSGHFIAGLGLEYHIADHFSNNDPRGAIKEYQFNLKPTIAYRLSNKITLGVAYYLGYGQEKISVGYKNLAYVSNNLAPRYVNYLINGYGEAEPRTDTKDRNYNDYQNRKGVEILFSLAATKIGSFYLEAIQTSEDQNYDYRVSTGITTLAHYQLDKQIINLFWKKNIGNGLATATLGYQHLAGKDYNLRYLANNYLYDASCVDLNINYTFHRAKNKFNYTFTAKQDDEKRIDGITGNKIYYTNIALKVGFGLNHDVDNFHSFGINFNARHMLSLNSDLSVSTTNESYFTREVIYFDYLYNTTSKWGGELSLNYSFPFFNAMQAGIQSNLGYLLRSETQNLNRPTALIPGKDRFYSNLSLNLYF